jgi:hypothetical protein
VVFATVELVTVLDPEGRLLTGVDRRVWPGVDGRVLTGVDDRAATGREAGTDGFDEGRVLILLLGVVGLELTEEMLALRTDDLMLLDVTADWIEGRELLRTGLEGTMECKFSVSEVESLDALMVEEDLVVVRLGTFERGTFSATSSAGTRGVPGGVRSQS